MINYITLLHGKQYLIQLLNKYLKGESANEEDELLKNYYDLFENEPDGLDLLSPEKKEEIKSGITRKTIKGLNAK